MYDRMEYQLQALESLRATCDNCAEIVYPSVESCLPTKNLRDNGVAIIRNIMNKGLNTEEKILLASWNDGIEKILIKSMFCRRDHMRQACDAAKDVT